MYEPNWSTEDNKENLSINISSNGDDGKWTFSYVKLMFAFGSIEASFLFKTMFVRSIGNEKKTKSFVGFKKNIREDESFLHERLLLLRSTRLCYWRIFLILLVIQQ